MFNCGPKKVYVIAGDHTRLISHNAKSNEMLVNSTGKPGVVYSQTVDGLCGNITYQFSAFITNMLNTATCDSNATLANLTFTIAAPGGAPYAVYGTGDIKQEGEVAWHQYGVFFTMPPTPTPLVLTITSNEITGCGSVFAIDDITLRPCGTRVGVTLDYDTVSVMDVCEGYTNPFILRASYIGFTNPKTIWQNSVDSGITWQDIPGAVNSSYAIPRSKAGATLYRIIVAEAVNFNSPKCRIASNPVWIGVHTAPPQQPLTHVSGCLDKDLKMPVIPGGSNYVWSGPNGYQSISVQAVVPAIQYSDTGLYIVTAISDFYCTTIDSVYVTVSPSVTLSVTKNYAVCEGQQVQFNASGGGTYTWTPGTGLSDSTKPNPVLIAKDSVRYQVLIENAYGCADSAIVEIDVFKKLSFTAGPDKYITLGDTAILTPVINGTAVNYYWTPGVYINDAAALNPKINPPLGETTYTLHAASGAGCGSGTDNVTVHVYNDMYIPNAFTPNGDGHNDVFRILPFDNYTLNRFTIYNRWGAIIFNTSNPTTGWDGRYNQQPQPAGTYIYYVEMTRTGGKRLVRRGTVLLIR
jgi:gliding motility-associated-like protein